jgi:V/A-type H+-transporting ATPase subunit C
MKSKTLQENDYINIMNLSNVMEVLDYLNDNTVYQEVLWDLKGKEVHRNDIESRLYRFRELIIEKLILYIGNEYKDFLKKYLLRYEIEDLKLVFKIVRGKINPEYMDNYIFTTSKYSNIDFSELLEQSSVLDVLKKLKTTKYYRLIKPYSENISEKFNFYLEMVLDRYYYNELIEAVQRLPKTDDEKAAEILRRKIDLYNLEWIYRATKHFDMSKEEILNFVLGHGFKYDYKKLKKIIYSFDPDNPLKNFAGTQYEFIFNHDYDIDLFMERRIDRYIYYKALNLYKSSILTFGKTISFIELIEFEIKDIFSIVESKRYHMSANEISKYLIRTIEVN